MISYYMITDKGDRHNNEDAVGVKHIDDKYCFIVADGLGGHGKGEEASALVKDSILESFSNDSTIIDFLEEAIEKAQIELLDEQKKKHTSMDLKTTLVALMLDDKQMKWIHIGDTRLYRFEKNKVKQRTIDHSVPQMLALAGDIKEKDIRNHPLRSKLMRVMGSEWEKQEYEVSEVNEINNTQAVLMCTDGFWEYITEKEMCKLLKKSCSVENWVQKMLEIVRSNGVEKNMDNYTAIAIWFNK